MRLGLVVVGILSLLAACGTDESAFDARCGDSECSTGESAATCPADCPSVCGDRTCSDDESVADCSIDCPGRCGDAVCSDEESAMICPADCPAVCGDRVCTHQERASTCAQDCPAVCGDQACTAGENPGTCPADCPSICGDTRCTTGETATSCPGDCPAGCGDGACTHTEAYATCAQDCASVCGDGTCASGETCSSCAGDCGTCLPEWIEVRMVGALIRPAMVDNRLWDGPDLSTEQLDAMGELAARLAGYPNLGEVVSFIAGIGINAWAPPDVFGTAEISLNGSFDGTNQIWLADESNNYEDTISPDWPGPRGWTHVPVSATMRIRVTLEDEDLALNDAIGTVELTQADLQQAWNASGVFGVPVHMQGVGHILFVNVSVGASTPPPVCGGSCDAGTYTACTCGDDDPCGWMQDGVCDSYCSMNFPADHFGDAIDCVAACTQDCQAGTYSACSCSSADPCGWKNDGVCDSACAAQFTTDYFNDAADCP